MKKHTAPPVILAVMIAASTTTSATAQDLSQILSGGSRFTHSPDSTIIISVRELGGDVCGNGFNFPRPGGSADAFDFPHPRRRIGTNEFPRLSRTLGNFALGSLRYFQLPVDSKTPDIVGCLDAQQNILFLNISPRRSSQPTPPAPTPSPVPPSPNTLQSPLPATPLAPAQNPQTQLFQINSGAQNFTPNSTQP
jgi:hypothetical protein